MKSFKKFVGAVVNLQEIVGTVLLTVFFIAILIQIIARYAGVAITWTEEVANYSFIWAVFMGASAMVYHRAHFSFTFLKDKLSGAVKDYYEVFLSLVLLCFTVPMFLYGLQIVDMFWYYNWITLPEVKMGYTWLCVPIMGATMTLYSVYHIANDLALTRRVRQGGAQQ